MPAESRIKVKEKRIFVNGERFHPHGLNWYFGTLKGDMEGAALGDRDRGDGYDDLRRQIFVKKDVAWKIFEQMSEMNVNCIRLWPRLTNDGWRVPFEPKLVNEAFEELGIMFIPDAPPRWHWHPEISIVKDYVKQFCRDGRERTLLAFSLGNEVYGHCMDFPRGYLVRVNSAIKEAGMETGLDILTVNTNQFVLAPREGSPRTLMDKLADFGMGPEGYRAVEFTDIIGLNPYAFLRAALWRKGFNRWLNENLRGVRDGVNCSCGEARNLSKHQRLRLYCLLKGVYYNQKLIAGFARAAGLRNSLFRYRTYVGKYCEFANRLNKPLIITEFCAGHEDITDALENPFDSEKAIDLRTESAKRAQAKHFAGCMKVNMEMRDRGMLEGYLAWLVPFLFDPLTGNVVNKPLADEMTKLYGV